jgi:hypothetical protein
MCIKAKTGLFEEKLEGQLSHANVFLRNLEFV